MPRWEIALRALLAGCVTGGILGAVLGGVVGVIYGVPVGMVLCLPGMLVATVLYPVTAERHGHADARAGTAAAVSAVTGVCVVAVGGAMLLIVVVPAAFMATMLGLRQGSRLPASPRASRRPASPRAPGWAGHRLLAPTVAVLVALLAVFVVVAWGVEWLQRRMVDPLDPTFVRYPWTPEVMLSSPRAAGARALLPALPYAVAVALLFDRAVRRLGLWAAAVLLPAGWGAAAVLVAGVLWGSGAVTAFAAMLAAGGGLVAVAAATGGCVALRLLRGETGWPRPPAARH